MLWMLEAKVDPCSSELLEHDRFVGERSTTAAVLFGYVGQEDARRAGRCPRFDIGAMLLPPPGLVRGELVVYELTHRRAERPQLVVHPRRVVGRGHQ